MFEGTQTTYKIGIYGARNVCARVSAQGYSCSSFVCDMSSGFSGNLGYSLPKDWAIDQISTITLGTGTGQIEIDNNICSNNNIGVSSITPNNSANGKNYIEPQEPSTGQSSSEYVVKKVYERIVVSGSEYDCLAELGTLQFEKRFKYNFIEPAINKLKDFKSKYPHDIITWYISSTAYDYTDLENFKDTANKLEVHIKFFEDSNEFVTYINKNRDKYKIGSLVVFSHGLIGSVEFGYGQKSELQEKLSLSIKSNLKNIKANSFSSDAFTQLYSCNGATKISDDIFYYGKSFAGEWYNNKLSKIKAAHGKTNYDVIFGDDVNEHCTKQKTKGYCEEGAVNYPVPSQGAEWVNFPS